MRQQKRNQGLQLDEKNLQILVETIPAPMWRAKPDGHIDYVNKRLLDYFGSPLEDIIGWGWMEKVHPDDIAFKVQSWLSNLEAMTSHDANCRFRGADGTYRWFNVRGEPLRDSDGSVQNWYGVLIDIDDQKKAQEKSRDTELKLRQIIEIVPGLVWSNGPDGEPTHINQRMLDYSGMPVEEFKRRGWEALVHPADYPETAEAFDHAIQTGTSYEGVMRLRRTDGEFRWHHARCEPLRDRQGRIIQWYGLSVDINERKIAEDRLRRSEMQLAAAQQLGQAGSFSWKPSTGERLWSDEIYRILDIDPAVGPDIGKAFELVDPDQRDHVRRLVELVGRGGSSIDELVKLLFADGSIKFIHLKSRAFRGDDGELEVVGALSDITKFKVAENSARESEYKLRQIIETVPGFLWSAGPDGEPTHVNQRILDYSNMQLEDFKHRGWEAFLHPDDVPKTARAFYQAIQTGEPYEAVHRLRRADGQYRWHHARGEPLRDEDHRIIQWYGLSVDIDERKQAEERLRRSEAYLAAAERLSHTGGWAVNRKGERTIVYWSEESYRIFGLHPPQAIPTREWVWQRIHPDDRTALREAAQQALDEKRDYMAAFRIVLADGTIKYLESNAHHLFSADDELLEIMGTFVDVTERKRSNDALRESEAKFRDYAETASDWFWETGPDYKFTDLTENAFGLSSADRIGTLCWDHALDLETEPEKWRLIWAVLDARESFRDFIYCTVDGSGGAMYVKASGKPVFDGSGKFLGYRGTGTDVTAIVRGQRAEASLQTVQAELAHVSRVMTLGQLTASIAHEVNQPIGSARNNARAALNFLQRSPPDLGEVKEALGCIVADADRAGGIIDRIRDQIKKVPPRSDRFDLNRAIEEVIGLAHSMIAENGVLVQSRLASGTLPVHGDRVQLQQVVLNLIVNAVEAMSSVEAGERELLISTDRSEAGGTLVAVRDSGPGIDPKRLEHVFEAFYSTKSGLGMGLSICRSIIAAHGGQLWAASAEPRGALFQFTLPVAEAKPSIARPFTV